MDEKEDGGEKHVKGDDTEESLHLVIANKDKSKIKEDSSDSMEVNHGHINQAEKHDEASEEVVNEKNEERKKKSIIHNFHLQLKFRFKLLLMKNGKTKSRILRI